MTFFDDLYGKLFPKVSHPPRMIHEVIQRSERYQKDYLAWQKSGRKDQQMQKLKDGYHCKKLKENAEYDVHLLSSSYANGFALSYTETIEKADFQFLFDLLAEKIMKLDYKLANSDMMITEKPDFIETKEKHYLKPKSLATEPPIDQQYGNILLEHILINDRPSYIKLMANIYSDSLYQPALSFDDLFNYLFHAES